MTLPSLKLLHPQDDMTRIIPDGIFEYNGIKNQKSNSKRNYIEKTKEKPLVSGKLNIVNLPIRRKLFKMWIRIDKIFTFF